MNQAILHQYVSSWLTNHYVFYGFSDCELIIWFSRIHFLVCSIQSVGYLFCLQTAKNCTGELDKQFKLDKYSDLTLIPNTVWPHGYDAAWALALMLNRTIEELENITLSNGTTKSLENFNYNDNGDREMAQRFFNVLKSITFEGLTVNTFFYEPSLTFWLYLKFIKNETNLKLAWFLAENNIFIS